MPRGGVVAGTGTCLELELLEPGSYGWSWSWNVPRAGAVGAGELWLELERDPRGTQVLSIFSSLFFVCFVCSSLRCKKKRLFFLLFCYATLQRNAAKKATATVAFFFLFWNCAATYCSEEGDGSNAVITFFFLF